ncbi:HD domain-containing protein [Clostridium pasteurianum]|uniref:Putative HD superfamily hydrolase, possibly a nuclease n=1 Tax=Clostridium pasteurianum BC1 TaxID=86416 RepID=R4K084_CLOPA|nr:HD domain-containing protein [Clostridium pasteurianum]AGK95196.1 putative HD superfamily hydrolase, possibly a nuclease [Clostridium pasteurianum BC1]
MIEEIIESMINYFGNDVSRINHALKVHGLSQNIGNLERLDDDKQFILEISAVLHDIGIKISEKKYNSSSGKYQELEGPKVAKEILEKFNLDSKILNRILYIIGNHHTYSKIDDIDFQILVESDFLVNIFEDNVKKDSIEVIKDKYFKTTYGTRYLNSMY